MSTCKLIALLGVLLCTTLVGRAQTAAPPAARGVPDGEFLTRYCTTCHSDRVRAAELSLESLDPTRAGDEAEVWERVVRKLRTGMMPPSGAPRPDRSAIDAFAFSLESSLDRAAAPDPNPGAPALHRLNRAEYRYAIRDLLALDVDTTTLLPADDSSAGFDNIADALGTSPALVEGYISAAAKISRLAVGDPSMGVSRSTYRVSGGLSQVEHIEGLPLGTRGGLLVEHTFPLDGEYDVRVGGVGRGIGPGRGASLDEDLEITVDGEVVEPRADNDFRLSITAGPHTIGAAIVKRSNAHGADDIWRQPTRTASVQSLTIIGPFNPTGPGDTPSRRRIFTCHPDASTALDEPCVTQILTSLATHGYRRPVSGSDPSIATLLAFYRTGRSRGGFEAGIQLALARLLVDPQFLFRFEEEPADLPAGAVYRVSDLELASRLSFFLWSSIPDDELLDVASRGALSDPATLDRQVRRMLADPRADALVSHITGQWLYLRELDKVRPESPDFDGNLRLAFRRETEMLFDTIVREDRSILDLLDADYTFVDERLARHYGMPNIRGSHVRRVTLDRDSPRRGLLGHGSILTVTSVANRTSPVTRGKWILENLLGTPPPVPPAGVEGLEVTAAAMPEASLRARMEQHRTSPACASCHRIMDPIGFALENFDLTGKWRDVDGRTPIDATGVLVDGTPLEGVAGLRRALLDRSDAFVTVATERLLTYALGRAVGPHDMPAVRAIVRKAADDDYRFSSIVTGIVESVPFRMRKKLISNEQ